jgi:hypothetical protein
LSEYGGYDVVSVFELTVSQVLLLSKSIQCRKSIEYRTLANIIRASVNGDKSQFSEMINSLQVSDSEKPTVVVQPDSSLPGMEKRYGS